MGLWPALSAVRSAGLRSARSPGRAAELARSVTAQAVRATVTPASSSLWPEAFCIETV